jgi:hypothetical protein
VRGELYILTAVARDATALTVRPSSGDPKMPRFLLFCAAMVLISAPAEAAVKYYDASKENGTPGDFQRNTSVLCPPLTETPDSMEGFARLLDDGVGTVTMDDVKVTLDVLTDLGEDRLNVLFGPGAFVFVDARSTRTIAVPVQSNTSGIGVHGPSSTAPGATTEWGLITGWRITGINFCASSPVAICNTNGFSHGATTDNVLPSDTYDLGTWSFDAAGDYAGDWYIERTSNGGITNQGFILRGAFQGASLPALPLVGFVALAASLAVVGLRSSLGRH